MAEASCHLASTLGRKFSIVTGGHRWGPMLEEFVAAIGLADQPGLGAGRGDAGSGHRRQPGRRARRPGLACRQAAQEDGAEVVILGGLGLAGLAERIDAEVPVPVIDNVVASVRVAEAAATLGVAKAKSGSFAAATPVKTTGLTPALAALLEGREA